MPTVVEYLDQLERLSSSDLTRQAEQLVRLERRHTARLIAHLAEIDRRKLHLEFGFNGLFGYCVQGLHLSEGSAWLRIQVARVCRKFPELLSALADGRLSLTVAGKLAPQMTAENAEKLISDCAGMTKREVEAYRVRLAPRQPVSPGLRKQSPREPLDLESARGAALPSPPTLAAESSRSAEPVAREQSPPEHRGSVEPCQPEVYNVRFPASETFKDKLERLAEVLGVRDVRGELAGVLETALDIALEKKDPAKRAQRRAEREARKQERAGATASESAAATESKPRPDDVTPREQPEVRSRYVPLPLRDRVLERADHRCEYTGRDGARCRERTGLELDHVQPFGRRGRTEEPNLRALCPAHNRWYAERCYGRGFMKRKIAAARLASRNSLAHASSG